MKPLLVALCALGTALSGTLAYAQATETEGEVAEALEEATEVVEEEIVEDPAFWVSPYGYLRVGYDLVADDPNFDFVGTNNGFVLHNARLGLAGGNTDWDLSFQISLDGAADQRNSVNTPQGDLDVRLRDAFVRWDVCDCFGVQVGQFKLPFSAEEMRSTADVPFISRAIGLNGVLVGQGLETEGIVVGRELGLMLSPSSPIYFGDFGFAYYAAVANGNGPNQLLNDNGSIAIAGRLEFYYSDLVRVGGGILLNERTIGELPNLFSEDDFGISADLLVSWEGLEVFGQLTMMTTEYATTGAADREQLAWHAQVSYVVDQLLVPFAPAYRIASFHPRAEGGVTDGGTDLDSFELMYHTIGLRVWVPDTPLTLNLNYTLTGEKEPRELENDLFQAMVQLVF